MTITVKNELSFLDLMKECWSGALDTLKRIEEEGLEDEFMDYLNMYMDSDYSIPTMTEVNDFLWFESDQIFKDLGISDEEDEDEEEE